MSKGRAVRFLLVEEFASPPDFVRWFRERIDVTDRGLIEVAAAGPRPTLQKSLTWSLPTLMHVNH